MNPSLTVIALGIYLILMGIIGYVRTKSPTAIGFNSLFGIVSLVLGWLLRGGSTSIETATMIWVGIIAATCILMATRRLMAPKRQTAPILIFASMAAFAVYAFLVLYQHRSVGI